MRIAHDPGLDDDVSVTKRVPVCVSHLRAIERSLRLVENHDVFRGLQVPA